MGWLYGIEQVMADDHQEAEGRKIDLLMAAGGTPEGDPLLEIARRLATLPVQPSAQAFTKFEQQLNLWFGPSAASRPVPMQRVPTLAIVLAGIAVLIVIVLLIVVVLIGKPSVFQPSVGPTMSSPTPTLIPTTAGTMQIAAD